GGEPQQGRVVGLVGLGEKVGRHIDVSGHRAPSDRVGRRSDGHRERGVRGGRTAVRAGVAAPARYLQALIGHGRCHGSYASETPSPLYSIRVEPWMVYSGAFTKGRMPPNRAPWAAFSRKTPVRVKRVKGRGRGRPAAQPAVSCRATSSAICAVLSAAPLRRL